MTFITILIGFIIIIANFIFVCTRYVISLVNVRSVVVTTAAPYMIFFIVFPILWWLYSTKEDEFNFYNRKNATLRLVIINDLLIIGQAIWEPVYAFAVYRITRLPVGRNFNEEMILNLCRIVLAASSLGFAFAVYSILDSNVLAADEVQEGINTFRWQHIVDERKNVSHLYDLKIVWNLVTGKLVTIKEIDRFVHMFVVGQSGTGKTSSTLIPAIICDLNKKLVNKIARQAALLRAIKAGWAVVKPSPESDKITEYNVIATEGNENKLKEIRKKYPDCGITAMAPNNSMIKTAISLAEARGQHINVLDPATKYDSENVTMVGMNPFYIPKNITAKERQILIINSAQSFSKVLVAVTEVQGTTEQYFKDINTSVTTTIGVICMLDASLRGVQTNMREIQDCIQDFTLLKPKLIQIMDAFKIEVTGIEKENNNQPDRVDGQETTNQRIKFLDITEDDVPEWFRNEGKTKEEYREYLREQAVNYYPFIFSTMSELLGYGFEKMYDQSRGLRNIINNLMLDPRIADILCAPDDKVLDFDRALQQNEITFVNTALEFGAESSTALGIFFMLNMKNAVMRRAHIDEPDRSDHFITIDEASQYMHPMYEDMFALFRQYRVAVTLALQTTSQMDKSNVTRYLKGVVLGAGIHIVFGRANSDEMKFYESLSGMENKETIQTQVNSNSEFDENYNVTKGQRVTVTREASLEAGAIRIRDFQEVSVFMVQEGRVLKGFLGKMRFPKKSEYKKKANVKDIDFSKYCTEALTTNKEIERINAIKKEEQAETVREYRTTITSSETQDAYIENRTSLPDGSEDYKPSYIPSDENRSSFVKAEEYRMAAIDDSVFDNKTTGEDEFVDNETLRKEQEGRLRAQQEAALRDELNGYASRNQYNAGAPERVDHTDPISRTEREMEQIKQHKSKIMAFPGTEPMDTNFSSFVQHKDIEIPTVMNDEDYSDEDVDDLIAMLDGDTHKEDR